MKTPRWLLTFTYGVDMGAIDAVVRIAEGSGGHPVVETYRLIA